LFPVTITDWPDGPEVGERLDMLGAVANAETAAKTTKRQIPVSVRRCIHVSAIKLCAAKL
jgi:hypothetical protein